MESLDAGVALAQRALFVALELSLPILLAGLCVGLCVSIFQTVTQVQEQTLAFLPKLLAMGGALVLLLPWLLSVITGFARDMFFEMGVR
jgi:flagellar biosynthetic protein FliQ